MTMEIYSTTFSTIQTILETLKALEDKGHGDLIVFIDDGCGHPYLFKGRVDVENGYAKFDGAFDSSYNGEPVATVNELIESIKGLDKDLKCIAEVGGAWDAYCSFDHAEINDYIECAELTEDEHEEYFGSIEQFVTFYIKYED